MTPNELDNLIIDVAAGKPGALETLYIKTKVTIFGLAVSILRDYTIAEDITHDVFIRISVYSNKYNPCGKGMAWILKITRNLAYNYLKKTKDSVSFNDELVASNIQVKDLDEEIILKEAILTLSIRQREIVILYAVSGLSHKEIAKFLNIAYPTVRWHYHKAIKKLKSIMERRL